MAERSVFEQQRRAKPRKGITRLIQIAGTKSILLFAAGFLGLIAVGARMTPFITVYLMVRELLENIGNVQGIDIDYVKRLGWITMAGIGAFGLITYAAMMLSHIAAYNILFEIRTALAAKLARLPLGYFNRRGSGGIKKVLSDDVERIELFVAHHITDVVQAIALPLLSFIFLFITDWRLAVGALLPIPLALNTRYPFAETDGRPGHRVSRGEFLLRRENRSARCFVHRTPGKCNRPGRSLRRGENDDRQPYRPFLGS